MTPAAMPAVAKKPAVERAKFPLVWKIFFLMALLIALVVAVAVGLTITRSQTIAHAQADKSISSAARLFGEFEKQRLARLSLTTQILGTDSPFVALMQKATHPEPEPAAAPGAPPVVPGINYADIFDQLNQRKEALGTDVMMLLDEQGNLLGRTDRPALTAAPNENMAAESPLVKQIVDDASIPVVSGVMADGSHLYHVAVALLLGGGGALLLAFILSWFMAKRVTRPIEELAGIAQAVTHGDYDVHPGIDRQDEVGILGRSFAKMITSLRDKAELEELYEQMAAKSEERGAARVSEPAMLEEGTVLVTDLRGLPPTVGGGDAAKVIADVARVMRLQEAEVERQDGVVREIIGHRLVSVFRGERGIIHAIRAARAINEELAAQDDTTMQIGVGIATGEFVTGSVDLHDESGLAIVGNAPLLAMVFAWDAPTGYAYISYETAQAAGNEILSSSTHEQVALRWLPQPLPVAAVPLVSLSMTMMRTLGQTTSSMATLRVDSTQPSDTAPAGAVAELVSGSLFANRYRIEQILGRGGMGIVYRAIDA